MLGRLFTKGIFIASITMMVLFLGYVLGFARGSGAWRLLINGHPSLVPVHLIKNMYFVSLNDLAKLPGWKVLINLSSREIVLDTPQGAAASAKASSQDSAAPFLAEAPKELPGDAETSPQVIEVKNENSGPPTNVRMTVTAAVSSLGELEKALDENVSADAIKEKQTTTVGIVQQAENLLWTQPRTRTLQADLQVALEDLESQINLILAMKEAKDGILPWSHPVSQTLFLKYPDLRPCHVVKEKIDGLDIACARKMMGETTHGDFDDVQRDLDEYR